MGSSRLGITLIPGRAPGSAGRLASRSVSIFIAPESRYHGNTRLGRTCALRDLSLRSR
jgi:hypothetical protein